MLVIFFISFCSTSKAQSIDPERLDIWLLESPFNTYPGRPYPSMRQSTSWTASTYNFLHKKIFEDQTLFPGLQNENRIWVLLPLDVLMDYLPLGSSWNH